MKGEVVCMPKKDFITLLNIAIDMYSAMQESYERLDLAYKKLEKLEQEAKAEQKYAEAFKDIKDAIKLARHLSNYYHKILGDYTLKVMEKAEKEQILKSE